jgi:putative colanic acid biosynthesis acetyltransferase WcaF
VRPIGAILESLADVLIDIERNRAAVKWTRKEQLIRILWAVAQPFFRFSPRVFWGWRVAMLRLFGASVGANVQIYPSVVIALPWNLTIDSHASVGDRAILYNLGRVSIGPGASISQGAHLCAGTHDYRKSSLPLLKLPISIGEGAWVCADAFVGPGVKIGNYAILGARAVAMRDIEDWTIATGNPAKPTGLRPRPISE